MKMLNKNTLCGVIKEGNEEIRYGIICDYPIWLPPAGWIYKLRMETGTTETCTEDELIEYHDSDLQRKLIYEAKQGKIQPVPIIKQQSLDIFKDIMAAIIKTPHNLKPDADAIKAIIEANSIKHLFHFTDRSNIASIIKHGGLYSWCAAEKAGIQIACPGGDLGSRKRDSVKGLEDYVRLSFHPYTPMRYVTVRDRRINQPIDLVIDINVIYWQDTLYCNQNANTTSACAGGTIEDLRKIKFELFQSTWKRDYNDAEENTYFQAEVLVKSHIPIQYVKKM